MTTSPGHGRVTVRRRLAGPQNRNLWFWVFVGPFVLGLTIFVYVPILWSVYLSFFDARNTVTPTVFVGFRNYGDMLTDPAFLSSLGTFIVFAVFIVPTTFAGALGLALLVHRARFAKAFFRSVYFLPTACSYVVASLIWKMSIFSGVRFGLMNSILRAVGLDSVVVALGHSPALVLARPGHPAPLAAARLLHDPVPGRTAAYPDRSCTRRPPSTGPSPAGRRSVTSPFRSCARRRWPC